MSTRRSTDEPFGDSRISAENDQQPGLAAPPSNNTSASPANNNGDNSSSGRSDVAYYHSFLHKLLELISNGQEEEVSRIISVIRSGASHRQILDMIEQLSESSSRPGRESNGVSNHSQ